MQHRDIGPKNPEAYNHAMGGNSMMSFNIINTSSSLFNMKKSAGHKNDKFEYIHSPNLEEYLYDFF